MVLLIALVVAFFLYRSLSSQSRREQETDDENLEDSLVEVVDDKKVCPPHKWNYVQVKDKEGNTLKWKIVCSICGPISGYNRPKNDEY